MKEILELLAKFGIGGGIGILIGLVVVSWVAPDTTGGTVLLILIPVIICIVVGGVFSAVFGGKKREHAADGGP
jgi:uncharacterized membrane protein YdjX (TVP38/TMEM64 family)